MEIILWIVPILWTMVLIMLWVILFLVLFLFLFILIPIRYCIEGDIGTQNLLTAKVSGFFRLISFFYTYADSESTCIIKLGFYKMDPFSKSSTSKPDKKEKHPNKKSLPLRLSNVQYLLTNIDIKSIITLGIMLLKKICKKIRPRHLSVRGMVGLKDPCTTGQFIGIYEAVVGAIGLSESIHLKGDFDKESLKLDGKLSGRFSIVSLIGPVIWFSLQKPVREGIKILKSERAIT